MTTVDTKVAVLEERQNGFESTVGSAMDRICDELKEANATHKETLEEMKKHGERVAVHESKLEEHKKKIEETQSEVQDLTKFVYKCWNWAKGAIFAVFGIGSLSTLFVKWSVIVKYFFP